MAGIEDKIAALETKLKQAKAQKQQIEHRKRAAEFKAKRLQDTRRKILVGAFVLEQTEKSGNDAAFFTLEGKRFDEWLLRKEDRELFNLPPKIGVPKPSETPVSEILSGSQSKTTAVPETRPEKLIPV